MQLGSLAPKEDQRERERFILVSFKLKAERDIPPG